MLILRRLMATAMTPMTGSTVDMTCNYKFSFIPGFFADYVEVAKGCPGLKATTQPGLGLLDRTYDTDPSPSDDLPQWKRFARYVENLIRPAPANVVELATARA